MRLNSAASEERQQHISGDDGGDVTEPGGEGEGSLLEATRKLVAMWQQAGKIEPFELTEEELKELSMYTSKNAKKKFLKFLIHKRSIKKAEKEKKQQRRLEREAMLEQKRQEAGDVKEMRNTFLLKYWSRSLDKVLAWKSAQAMLFNQPLVFDMSYESHMTRRELENTVSQLIEADSWNRHSAEPFHLHFCNLVPGGGYLKELIKRYTADGWNKLLITSTERQHVDLFPRENLVYLTADSPNVLRKIDHSKVYIVGAMVDRSIQTGLSMANAKRLKLATARLPLDEFLHWGMGGKNLTLDQVVRIMLTFKDTGKWEEALKFVPTRKHGGFVEQRSRKEVTFRQDPRLTRRVSLKSQIEMRNRADRGKTWQYD